MQIGNDGQVEFGGEGVDGFVRDAAAFVGDFAVVEIEEIECAASLVRADLGALLMDVLFENDLDIALAVEDGAFRADPHIEDEGGRLGDREEEDPVEANHGRQERADF